MLRPWQTRTNCCGHVVADTNVSPFARSRNICCGHKNVSDFVQKHFVSATNVSQFAQPKKHRGQQCVRNNVSSFARALSRLKVRTFKNCGRFYFSTILSEIKIARIFLQATGVACEYSRLSFALARSSGSEWETAVYLQAMYWKHFIIFFSALGKYLRNGMQFIFNMKNG